MPQSCRRLPLSALQSIHFSFHLKACNRNCCALSDQTVSGIRRYLCRKGVCRVGYTTHVLPRKDLRSSGTRCSTSTLIISGIHAVASPHSRNPQASQQGASAIFPPQIFVQLAFLAAQSLVVADIQWICSKTQFAQKPMPFLQFSHSFYWHSFTRMTY